MLRRFRELSETVQGIVVAVTLGLIVFGLLLLIAR
jgi:hypothetical protein